MKQVRPLLLVTNDDGISAPGIRALIAVMSEIGDVVVVAPDKPQSAMGHAITINSTLYLNKISKENDTITEYSCSGTPVDCVKLAVNEILKRKPDLCVSGVNHGSNSSINVIYSGTMSAAVEAGIAALPIVGLVAFLIGVILSFQAAIGMQQFGAVSFVGPLAALGIVREMGPLITAILLAGRSSAAFAAEIGTMTVNSEVDALVSGGLSPIRFLVVPRVLAGILVAPILTLFADIVSIFSSMLTMLIYGIPFVNFYNGMLSAVDIEDILSGLLKATLFGVVVSAMGCLRGMQTGTGAAAVGISATRAVVSSIVMIVIVDGIFAFISYKTGF